jgi:predicted transcriptional regulator YheO
MFICVPSPDLSMPSTMIIPRTKRERALVLEILKQTVEGLGRALGPNIEVVLHDIAMPDNSVVAIANGTITGRSIGSAIISGPFDDVGLDELLSGRSRAAGETYTIISGYKTRTRSGHVLDSTSVLFRDEKGKAYAALCINHDRSRLREVKRLIDDLIGSSIDDGRTADPDPEPCVDALIHEIIQDGIRSTGKTVSSMSKEDKVDAVHYMNKRGLFLIRSSVDIAASSLAVSRFTIYNYLDELKKSVKA